MSTNRDRFLRLVSKEKTDTSRKNKERINNREKLREERRMLLAQIMQADEGDGLYEK